jgi:hypothetical protein
LWITFVGEQLCWGLLTTDPPERHPDGNGVTRNVAGGWRWKDVNGEQLTKDRLSGALTKLAAYQGTSCKVDVEDYAVRRINGQMTPQVERAVATLEVMRKSVLELMQDLLPVTLKHWWTWYSLRVDGGGLDSLGSRPINR